MVGGVTAAAQATTPGEQAVIAGEHQWLKSQQTNNVQLLAPLLADKVVYSTEDRMFEGKSAVLAAFKSYTFSDADYKNLRVRLFGRTAIATGVFTGTVKSAGGKTRNVRLRFTDTWVEMSNGKWLCVATQD
jgi:ketosteroid isomerase-like protein